MVTDETRYARADGLARFIERADERLDRAVRETRDRADRLDNIARAVAAAPTSRWDFERILMVAAATEAWDGARRLYGEPGLCIANQRPASSYPFASLGGAMAFWSGGRVEIGLGTVTIPSVQDRTEDLQRRNILRSIGVEFVPVHPSKSSTSADPKGLRRLDLLISTEAAIARAIASVGDPRAIGWLLAMTIGEPRRVPKKRRLGVRSPHRQLEHVRMRAEDAIVDGHRVQGLASRDGVTVRVVQSATRRLRGRIIEELVMAELLQPPTRARRARPAQPPPPAFADW
mgnify:CR=1 FL=1